MHSRTVPLQGSYRCLLVCFGIVFGTVFGTVFGIVFGTVFGTVFGMWHDTHCLQLQCLLLLVVQKVLYSRSKERPYFVYQLCISMAIICIVLRFTE